MKAMTKASKADAPLRVAFVVPSGAPLFSPSIHGMFGGAEVQQMLLGEYLVERGHEVKAIVRKPTCIDRPAIEGEIELIPFSTNWASGNNLSIPADMASLAIAMLRADADVYVMKVPRVLLAAVGTVARLMRRRFVFWLTSDRDVNVGDVHELAGNVAAWSYRLGLKLPHHAIAQNRFQLQGCRNMGLNATFLPSLVRVPNSDWWQAKSCPPVVLWVGSHTGIGLKHPELFVELARALPDIRFNMIATTDTAERQTELDTAAESIPNLEFLGAVEYGRMEQYYQQAALFVSTSELEGFPNTFLQSWANGTPVVSLRVDPDAIFSRKRLGVCTHGDMKHLIQETRRLVMAPGDRKAIGREARRHVEEAHGIRSVGARYLELFEKVLSGQPTLRE